MLLEDKGVGEILLPESQKYLSGFFKSVNGGFGNLKKYFILTGKLKPIYAERQQHQQEHPSLMYGQFG